LQIITDERPHPVFCGAIKSWQSPWARFAMVSLLFLGHPAAAWAADWSATELHYQHGSITAPEFAGGASSTTDILTFQHASGWAYGDSFFFIDYLRDSKKDGFNDHDFYGELYVNFSLGKISGKDLGFGPIKDIGLLAGLNAGADANVVKYLPGIRIVWDIPGFAFLNLDVTLFMDASPGAGSGGAPKEKDSWYVDINWAYPFQIGGQGFSIEGHAEYIAGRKNEFGDDVKPWILAQPQLRWDAGGALGAPGRLYVGVEWQYWQNKLGGKKSESAGQALVVWRL